jgi:hypothetical protein
MMRVASRLVVNGWKSYIKGGLRSVGLDVRRAQPSRRTAPPAPALQDPLKAVSEIRAGEAVVVKCPIADCVTLNGLTFGEHGWHPFVAALQEWLARPNTRYAGSILEKYYSIWQPKNGLEALIGAGSGPRSRSRYPGYLLHAPWNEASPEERLRFIAKVAARESLMFGRELMTIEDGYSLHGPVCRKKGELEYQRLIRVAESIRDRGFDRSLGDVTASILKRGDQFRFLVSHGHHRAAAVAALGLREVCIAPRMLVIAEEVDHWPQVYRGVWTREEALTYFDHQFDFNARGWAEQLGLLPPL